MKDEKAKAGISRRGFLRGTGVTGGAVGVAAATVAVSAPSAPAKAASGGRPSIEYRETEHVRRTYALARF